MSAEFPGKGFEQSASDLWRAEQIRSWSYSTRRGEEAKWVWAERRASGSELLQLLGTAPCSSGARLRPVRASIINNRRPIRAFASSRETKTAAQNRREGFGIRDPLRLPNIVAKGSTQGEVARDFRRFLSQMTKTPVVNQISGEIKIPYIQYPSYGFESEQAANTDDAKNTSDERRHCEDREDYKGEKDVQ